MRVPYEGPAWAISCHLACSRRSFWSTSRQKKKGQAEKWSVRTQRYKPGASHRRLQGFYYLQHMPGGSLAQACCKGRLPVQRSSLPSMPALHMHCLCVKDTSCQASASNAGLVSKVGQLCSAMPSSSGWFSALTGLPHYNPGRSISLCLNDITLQACLLCGCPAEREAHSFVSVRVYIDMASAERLIQEMLSIRCRQISCSEQATHL